MNRIIITMMLCVCTLYGMTQEQVFLGITTGKVVSFSKKRLIEGAQWSDNEKIDVLYKLSGNKVYIYDQYDTNFTLYDEEPFTVKEENDAKMYTSFDETGIRCTVILYYRYDTIEKVIVLFLTTFYKDQAYTYKLILPDDYIVR